MIHIEKIHTFPVDVGKGFAYITDIHNWMEYWPGLTRIKDLEAAKWKEAGHGVTVGLRLLGREVEMSMHLEQFQQDALVAYVSHQAGLPDVHHERHFEPVPDGFKYRLVVEYEPRKGWAGLFDRFVLRRSVARALQRTIENLQGVFRSGDPLEK